MQIIGELKNDKILISEPKEIGRLFNKSHFGKTLAENKLQLDLLEGVFLLDEKKIKIFSNKKEIDFKNLVIIATENIKRFEIKYLVFKDLRKRGNAVKLLNEIKADLYDFNEKFYVSIFSERDILSIGQTRKTLKETCEKNKELWYAIVDEEGDITYYKVSLTNLKGITKKHPFKKSLGIYLNDRVVIFDKNISKNMFEKEFFGKPFGEGLQLSLIEAFYLLDKGYIEVQSIDGKNVSLKEFEKILNEQNKDFNLKLLVFNDLKNRGLLVKTGFKFGAHFRAYSKSPDKTHAEFLIHVVDKDFTSIWAEISRAVRLAHSVNKDIIFARVSGKNVEYIKFGRLRP